MDQLAVEPRRVGRDLEHALNVARAGARNRDEFESR
jgi:hypothetical protein